MASSPYSEAYRPASREQPVHTYRTIGGVSTTGGIGTVGGVLVGVLVFELLKIVLQFLDVNPYYNYIVQGLVIVTAVALDIRKYIAKK